MEKKQIKYSLDYMLYGNFRNNKDVNSLESYLEAIFNIADKDMKSKIEKLKKRPPYVGYELSSGEPEFKFKYYGSVPSLEFTFVETDVAFKKRMIEEEKRKKQQEEDLKKAQELNKKREEERRKSELSLLRGLAKKYGAQLKIPKDATANNDDVKPKTRTRRKQTV